MLNNRDYNEVPAQLALDEGPAGLRLPSNL